VPPYDHHVFYNKFVTESVERDGEVEDALIDVIYTHWNLISVALSCWGRHLYDLGSTTWKRELLYLRFCKLI